MASENARRPRRVPLTPEEVANIIAFKKRRELIILHKLKSSREFKILNIINIVCFFVYFELLLCFLGPCHYRFHKAASFTTKYGNNFQPDGKPIVSEIDVYDVNGTLYNFVVEDFIKIPLAENGFFIGKDYLLQKDLKGKFERSGKSHRLFSASPIILLSVLILLISSVGFYYNLNQNAYSLMALTVLNSITIMGILML